MNLTPFSTKGASEPDPVFSDEPITVAFPNWTFEVLADATTVQHWYENRNRNVLANKNHDYLRDRSRMFHFGPQGMFAPGALPPQTWG